MAIRGGLTKRDEAGPDLSRRIVARGKIGVAGRVPKNSQTLAAAIGLPHKEAWTAGLGRKSGRSFALGQAAVWPLRDAVDVALLVADLRSQGLKAGKIADLETYLIRQIRSPDGVVIAARPSRMRRATSLVSLFREVEVDASGAVGYHVHIEEMIDLSAGSAGGALREAFVLQASADLAALAHSLKRVGRERPVSVICESNNADTHRWAPVFGDLLDEAAAAIRRNPEFVKATAGVAVEPSDHYCW